MISSPFFGLADRSITLDMQNNVGSDMFFCEFPHEIGWFQGLSSSIEKYEDNSNVLHPVQVHCCSSTEENVVKWHLKCTVSVWNTKNPSKNKKKLHFQIRLQFFISFVFFTWLFIFLINKMCWVQYFIVSTLYAGGSCMVSFCKLHYYWFDWLSKLKVSS